MKECFYKLVQHLPEILKGLIALVILLIIFFGLDILAQIFEAKAETPVQARVDYVIDGDTADIFVGSPRRQVRLRLRGIDAPEMEGQCPYESRLAAQAKAALKALMPPGTIVYLSNLGRDKYGRLLADTQLADGRRPGRILIAQGLAVPFGFGRPDWCKGKRP